MTWPPAVVKFASAIKVAEGSNPLWNNPLSLTGADASGFPVVGIANAEGVLMFRYAEDGWNAGCMKVERMLRGLSKVYLPAMTLAEVGVIYAGSKAPNWADNVAKELGVPTTMTLGQWAAANL